jgi:hypothetical protein
MTESSMILSYSSAFLWGDQSVPLPNLKSAKFVLRQILHIYMKPLKTNLPSSAYTTIDNFANHQDCKKRKIQDEAKPHEIGKVYGTLHQPKLHLSGEDACIHG